MSPQYLVSKWLEQKFQNKQEELNNYVIQFLADNSKLLPEFQDWLANQKANTEAQLTDKALEAAKLNTQQQLQAQLDAVDTVLNDIGK